MKLNLKRPRKSVIAAAILIFLVAAGAALYPAAKRLFVRYGDFARYWDAARTVVHMAYRYPDDIASLRADIDALQQQIRELSLLVLQSSPNASDGSANRGRTTLPSGSEYKSDAVAVFSSIDAVSIYQKNGRVEVYGGAYRERHAGAVRVAKTVFEISHDTAWLFWFPDFSPMADSTHIRVRLATPPRRGRMVTGFVLKTGEAFSFAHRFGEPSPIQSPTLAPEVPRGSARLALAGIAEIPLQQAQNGDLVAALPATLRQALQRGSDEIDFWFLRAEGMTGERLELLAVSGVRPKPDGFAGQATVAGRVDGASIAPTASVELLMENGKTLRRQLSPEGRFRFDGIDPQAPVSIRFEHDKRYYYSTLGRWFIPAYLRTNLVVDLRPHYVNSDGHPPDPKWAKWVQPREPSKVSAVYAKHARLQWPGGSKIQEYASIIPTNNWGFVDRDRFFDNPDGCVRVVHLGSSHAVALQVRIFEKFNILMEAELSVRLGKCVEVISAGIDNGDIGANYPRLRDYAIHFKPNVILMENSAALVLQLHPTTLKEGFGWDHDHSGVPNFYYNANGVLSFRPAAPDYGLYATKPSYPSYVPGVPFFKSVMLPFQDMPELGRKAFEYLAAILRYYRQHHPDQVIVMHSALDQAQCRTDCIGEVTLPSGNKTKVGAEVFVENIAAFCEKHDLLCINPPVPEGFDRRETYLTFIYDGHYSERGHQWLARVLSDALIPILAGS